MLRIKVSMVIKTHHLMIKSIATINHLIKLIRLTLILEHQHLQMKMMMNYHQIMITIERKIESSN